MRLCLLGDDIQTGKILMSSTIIAEVDKIPEPGKYGNDVSEVVTFTKDTIPSDMAFGKQKLITPILNG